MELTGNFNKELTFEEVEIDELYGDAFYIGGAVLGLAAGGAIWAGVVIT